MNSPQRTLVLLTLINLLNYLDRYVVAAVLEPLGHGLSLDDVELGRLTFVFVIVYMLSAPLFGWLADRHHRPRLIALGVAIWSVATMGAAFVNDYGTLLVTRSFVGVGEAAYASLGPAVLSDCFHENERAKRFTWFYLAIPVGSALGYGLGGIVAQHFGWRAAFLVAGLPGLFFAARMARLPDPERGAMDVHREAAPPTSMRERLRGIFANRVWVACTASYVAYTFAMGALSTWGPTLLQRKFGVTTGEAGTVFGGIAVVTGILGTFAGGFVTDKLQHRFPNAGVDLSAVTLLLAAPAVYVALHTANLPTTYGCFFLAMLLLFVNTSPVNAMTVSALPASVRATGTAVNVLLIHLLGDAFSPEWVGHRSERSIHAGTDAGLALAGALEIALPAILLAGVFLAFARSRPEPSPSPA